MLVLLIEQSSGREGQPNVEPEERRRFRGNSTHEGGHLSNGVIVANNSSTNAD